VRPSMSAAGRPCACVAHSAAACRAVSRVRPRLSSCRRGISSQLVVLYAGHAAWWCSVRRMACCSVVFAVCMLDLPVGIAANLHLGYAAKVGKVWYQVGVRCGVGCREDESRWCCGLLIS